MDSIAIGYKNAEYFAHFQRKNQQYYIYCQWYQAKNGRDLSLRTRTCGREVYLKAI